MNEKTLGTFIAAKRKEKGLTQKQLAEMLGVSDKTVSHWEREESAPDISLLPVIADIFGITADELLRCEEKAEAAVPKEKEQSASLASEYLTNSIFSKYKARSLISIAAAVVALLVFFLVEYYKTRAFAFLVFLTLLVIPVFLTIFFRASLSSHLTSPYTDKNQAPELALKANRITVNCLYLDLLCSAIAGLITLAVIEPLEIIIVPFILAVAGIILACESILKRLGILKASDKPRKKKRKLTLNITCAFVCIILLYCGFVSHSSINYEEILLEKADYIEVQTEQELISLMETEADAPRELSSCSFTDFTPDDYGNQFSFYYQMGTGIAALSPELNTIYTYKNLEVAAVRTGGNIFMVYYHSQLIEAEKEAHNTVKVLSILHFVYYAAVILLTLFAHRRIKKKLGL